MTPNRVGALVMGSTIVGLFIGAALIAAQVDRSGSPATIPGTVEWRFSEPQPDWKSALPVPGSKAADLERTPDALRVTLSDGSRISEGALSGGIYVDLPHWRREEWADVIVRARTTGSVNRMLIGLNTEGVLPAGAVPPPLSAVFLATFQALGGVTPIVRDGLVHTYRIHLDWSGQRSDRPYALFLPNRGAGAEGPWRRVGLEFQAPTPASIDILSVSVVPASAGRGQAQVTETILQPSQLKSDFALFRKALEEAHPALYRFTTKRELDAEFAKAEPKLTRPMTTLQFRNVLEPVLTAITDGHLGFTNYHGDEISAVVNSAKQFPLVLQFESTRALVVLNQGLDERVKPGMEVMDINGKSLPETLQRILPKLTHDGDVQSWQMYLLGISRGFFQQGSPGRAGFSEAYRLYIANPPSFKTTLRDPHTRKIVVVDLPGVTPAEAAVNVEKNPVNRDVLTGLETLRADNLHQRQSIRYLDGEDTAVLIPQWNRNSPDFLKEAFAGLGRNGTKNLIVDLRGNTGGFDQIPTLLFSYFTSKEFRTVEGDYVKTFQPSFKQYTALEIADLATDSYYGPASGIWKPDPRGGWLITEKYPTIGVQKPSENHFDGPVYVLIDGGSFSASPAFTILADYYKRATFIGEETGGVGSGGAGTDIGPTLPESHLHVHMSMEMYFSVVDKNAPRRGTLPKYKVTQTIDDLARGRDTVLEFTRELIRSGKER